jgi:hypothetical protein
MSNDAAKADQIAYRIYTKLALVVSDARAPPAPPAHPPAIGPGATTPAKVDKWVCCDVLLYSVVDILMLGSVYSSTSRRRTSTRSRIAYACIARSHLTGLAHRTRHRHHQPRPPLLRLKPPPQELGQRQYQRRPQVLRRPPFMDRGHLSPSILTFSSLYRI